MTIYSSYSLCYKTENYGKIYNYVDIGAVGGKHLAIIALVAFHMALTRGNENHTPKNNSTTKEVEDEKQRTSFYQRLPLKAVEKCGVRLLPAMFPNLLGTHGRSLPWKHLGSTP